MADLTAHTVAELVAALLTLDQDAPVIGLECKGGLDVVPQNSGAVLIVDHRP